MRIKTWIQPSPKSRRGFTVIELLVVVSIIGILLSLTLPAVQNSRESARAMQCKSQLRQFGQALHNFESGYQSLPAGNDFANDARHSWCTRVLPFLDQAPLYNRYDFSKRWNDSTGPVGQSNNDVTSKSMPVFTCPSEPIRRPGGIDYGGNFGTSLTGMNAGFDEGDGWEAGALLVINAPGPRAQKRPAPFGEFSDGLSQTFMVFESTGLTSEGGQWGSGTNCMPIEYPVNANALGQTIVSHHPGGGHALFSDGHVSFLSNSTDLNVLGKLATRNQGEVVDGSF